jgi:hypothetical protein
MSQRVPPDSLGYWAAVLCGCLAAFWPATPAVSQDALSPTIGNLTTTEECRRCHFRNAAAEPTSQFGENDGFCAEQEANLWAEKDKHRQSLYLLLEGPGKELTHRILGFDLRDVLLIDTPEMNVGKKPAELLTHVRFNPDLDRSDPRIAAARECFACHAPIDEPMTVGRGQTTLEYGVSCQACHGPGFSYVNPHKDVVTKVWRVITPEAKETRFGMRDLRNPVRRAELCNSCHVGSFSKEWRADAQSPPRFVKHEWYAKGHPPLPTLEYVTFASAMPAHWMRIQEKLAHEPRFAYCTSAPEDAEVQKFFDQLPMKAFLGQTVEEVKQQILAESYVHANRASLASQDPAVLALDAARTRDVLVSGLAVMANYSSLLEEYAGRHADFALYDCGACHHELRSQPPREWRVRRGLAPGRLPPAFWTLALSRLAFKAEGTAESDFENQWKALNESFSKRPLGDFEQIRAHAKDLRTTCTEAAKSLAIKPLTPEAIDALLATLANPTGDVDRDYHAARQYAWALREALRDRQRVPYAGAAPEIDNLFGGGPWQGPLRLKLPSGQETSITNQLPESLHSLADYDRDEFLKRLALIRQQFSLPTVPTIDQP